MPETKGNYCPKCGEGVYWQKQPAGCLPWGIVAFGLLTLFWLYWVENEFFLVGIIIAVWGGYLIVKGNKPALYCPDCDKYYPIPRL